MDKHQKWGVVALLVSLFYLIWIPSWDKVMFLPGIPYGVIFLFHGRIERFLVAKPRRPLLWYGAVVAGSGMLLETLAYVSNLGRIAAGERVHLFSTVLWRDLLVGFPHYVAVGWVWAWVLARYRLSVFQQALLIGVFWAMIVDEFSYLKALLAGDVFIFLTAGLLLVFGLNWPLVLFQHAIEEKHPDRTSHWTKLPIAFVSQIIPMFVLLGSAAIVNGVFGP